MFEPGTCCQGNLIAVSYSVIFVTCLDWAVYVIDRRTPKDVLEWLVNAGNIGNSVFTKTSFLENMSKAGSISDAWLAEMKRCNWSMRMLNDQASGDKSGNTPGYETRMSQWLASKHPHCFPAGFQEYKVCKAAVNKLHDLGLWSDFKAWMEVNADFTINFESSAVYHHVNEIVKNFKAFAPDLMHYAPMAMRLSVPSVDVHCEWLLREHKDSASQGHLCGHWNQFQGWHKGSCTRDAQSQGQRQSQGQSHQIFGASFFFFGAT